MPALTDAQLAEIETRARTLKVIHLGLGVGVTIFAGIVVFLSQQDHPEGGPDQVQLGLILSTLHVLVLAGCVGAAQFLFGQKAGPEALRRVGAEGGPQAVLNALQTAHILRAALLEGPALMALVALLVSTTNGALAQQKLLWLNLTWPVIFVVLVTGLSPGADALREQVARALD